DLIKEVAEALAGSGWRDTGDGTPPEDLDVTRAVWDLLRRCELWGLVAEERGPGFATRLRLSDAGVRGAHTALRLLALRPRMDTAVPGGSGPPRPGPLACLQVLIVMCER